MTEQSNVDIYHLGLTILRKLAEAPEVKRVALAGGAVRDNLAGLPIKDLDFLVEFVSPTADNTDEHIEVLAAALEASTDDFYVDDEALYEGHLFASIRVQGTKVEFIETQSIEDEVDGYPDSISKVYLLPSSPTSSGLVLTKAYLDTIANRTITFARTATPARVSRIVGKFPAFTAVHEEAVRSPWVAQSVKAVLPALSPTELGL